MKFDVIVGNPPYQSIINNKKDPWLYMKFIYLFYGQAKQNGYINVIINANWANLPSCKNFQSWLSQHGLFKYTHLDNNHFPNVQVTTCLIEIRKDIISNNITIIDLKGITSVQPNNNKLRFISLQKQTRNILDKLSHYSDTKNFLSIYNHSNLQRVNIKKDPQGVKCIFSAGNKDEDFDWGHISKEHITTSNNKFKAIGMGKWKVIMPNTYGRDSRKLGNIKIASPDYYCSIGAICFLFNTELEAIYHKEYLESNLVKFIVYYNKISSATNSKTLLSQIPLINLTSSVDIYEHFNLTPEEIKYINEK